MPFRRTALLTVTLAFAAGVLPAASQTTGARNTGVAQRAFQLSVSARLAERKSQCMKAVGSSPFCDCLNGALPLDTSFQQYIAVTTARDVERNPEDQARHILSARDSCVATAFPVAK
jgi:hypothetical protein